MSKLRKIEKEDEGSSDSDSDEMEDMEVTNEVRILKSHSFSFNI